MTPEEFARYISAGPYGRQKAAAQAFKAKLEHMDYMNWGWDDEYIKYHKDMKVNQHKTPQPASQSRIDYLNWLQSQGYDINNP